MSPFENIVGVLHDLSVEEKMKLRVILDEELKPWAASGGNAVRPRSELIGLFADEPELIDEVMVAAYEQRALPLRLDH